MSKPSSVSPRTVPDVLTGTQFIIFNLGLIGIAPAVVARFIKGKPIKDMIALVR